MVAHALARSSVRRLVGTRARAVVVTMFVTASISACGGEPAGSPNTAHAVQVTEDVRENAASPGESNDDEPPLELTVHVGDQTVQTRPGATAKLRGSFRDPEISVEVAPWRRFDKAGLSFPYPSYFAYEADRTSPGVDIWTMTGNSTTIIVFHFDGVISADDLRASIVKELDARDVSVATASFDIGGAPHPAHDLHVALAGQPFTQRLVELPPLNGDSRFLLIQGSPSVAEDAPPEVRSVLERIGEDFDSSP
jgi:hypothetical protein